MRKYSPLQATSEKRGIMFFFRQQLPSAGKYAAGAKRGRMLQKVRGLPADNASPSRPWQKKKQQHFGIVLGTTHFPLYACIAEFAASAILKLFYCYIL